MGTSLGAFVIGTPDPAGSSAFYRRLLGWLPVEGSVGDDFIRLRAPERERPGLSFQREPGFVAPVWPARDDEQQMHAHLDVLVDDLEVDVGRALDLGATREDHQPADGVVVLRDPFGSLFCLFVPG